MNLRRVVIGLFAVIAFVGVGETAAFADICLVDDNSIVPVSFQLQVGTGNPGAGTPIVVTGERLVVLLHRHPLVGSLRVVSTGGFEIGFQVTFDFASGTWQHPVETGIFRFLTNGTITYDVTYHGNGTPSTSKGFMHIVPCPVLAPALGGATDPNAAN